MRSKEVAQRKRIQVDKQEQGHPVSIAGNCPKCGNPIYADSWVRTYDGTLRYYDKSKPPYVLRTCECFPTPDRFDAEKK